MVKNAAHEDRELGLVYRVDDIDGLGKPAKESERVQQQSRNKWNKRTFVFCKLERGKKTTNLFVTEKIDMEGNKMFKKQKKKS
jgi:hypothetical protein